MLTIAHLTARYGDSLALDDVSLSVGKGDFYGVLGVNGAGKSTLLRAVAGLNPPAVSGSIRLEDQEIIAVPAHVRPRLGIGQVPEGRRMFSSLTVQENLLMGAYGRPRAWQRERLDRILQTFPELANRTRQVAGSLSGGEQQMVAIGRALMSEPRLLLLDEPSLGLAPIVVSRVFSLLKSLHAEWGLTIVLVEQNAEEAFGLLTRCCLIQRGSVVFEGTPAELAGSETVSNAYFGS